MSQETRNYTVYAKEGVQIKTSVTTLAGEELEIDYPCWVYYVNYHIDCPAGMDCMVINSGRYLIVNETNGNLLEINANGKGIPNDLAEWRKVDIKDLIASNLLKKGSADTTFLIGKWDVVKLAYTANGNEISDVTAISKAILTIPIAITPIENYLQDRWKLDCVNSIWFVSSLSDNLIELAMCGSTFVYVPDEHEENHIVSALTNAYSFVIIDDELIIYFIGIEDRNLLILKNNKL